MTVLDVPHLRQSQVFSCGPAAVRMVLKHWGISTKESDLIKKLGADPDLGTPPHVLVNYFRSKRFKHKQKHNMGMRELQEFLDRGWPVIVTYQAWAHKPSQTNYHTSWDNGHYSVVSGYTSDSFMLADPSSKRPTITFTKEDFIGRWRDITANGKIYKRWGLAVGPRYARRTTV